MLAVLYVDPVPTTFCSSPQELCCLASASAQPGERWAVHHQGMKMLLCCLASSFIPQQAFLSHQLLIMGKYCAGVDAADHSSGAAGCEICWALWGCQPGLGWVRCRRPAGWRHCCEPLTFPPTPCVETMYPAWPLGLIGAPRLITPAVLKTLAFGLTLPQSHAARFTRPAALGPPAMKSDCLLAQTSRLLKERPAHLRRSHQ